MGAVGWQSWSQGNSGPAGRQISHLLAEGWELYQSIGVPPELRTEPSCLADAEMGRGGTQDVPWSLGLEIGQLIWEASHLPVLATGVGCTCACGVCWSCSEELATGKMMR